MSDITQSAVVGWSDVLLKGVSGLIDSQITRNFGVSDPKYNTAGGTGGQAQATPVSVAASPVVWIAGAALLVLVVFVALRR